MVGANTLDHASKGMFRIKAPQHPGDPGRRLSSLHGLGCGQIIQPPTSVGFDV